MPAYTPPVEAAGPREIPQDRPPGRPVPPAGGFRPVRRLANLPVLATRLLLVAGVAAIALAAVLISTTVIGLFRGVNAAFDGQLIGAEPVVVYLDAGQERTLWAEGPAANCTVLALPGAAGDAAGEASAVTVGSTSARVTLNGRELEAVGSFAAPRSGEYRVSCEGAAVRLAEGPGAGDVVRGVGGIFGGVLALLAGIAALAAAGVATAVRRSRRTP